MLALAAARARPPGAAPVEFGPGDVGALPFGDGSFDVVTSTQVYEYVADMPAALAQARRVLRPGGRLLVLDTGYDPRTYSAGLIDFVSAFVPGRAGLTQADVTAWRNDLAALGEDYFFSLNRYVFVATT
jgi:arsenite methyltransferase